VCLKAAPAQTTPFSHLLQIPNFVCELIWSYFTGIYLFVLGVYEAMQSHFSDVDPFAETRPSPALTQSISIPPQKKPKKMHRDFRFGCAFVPLLLIILVGLVFLGYLLIPLRTNIVILGIDDRQPGEAIGRSDTIILTTFVPLKGYVGMLSIPRDLWVQVPGHGENRINTAHFFAEAEQPGAGLQAAKEVIEVNFGIDVRYAVRLRFDSFMQVVDTLGGLEVSLDQPTAGYTAGTHLLSSEEALAFVRDRQGSDDFFRMERGQIFIRSLLKATLSPKNLTHLPQVLLEISKSVETDVPFILWPKLAINLLVGGIGGIDTRTITREMVNPFTTSGGAQVLAPNWDAINPVLLEMFGQ
jgi:LCP family protein required for cell wall assembly